VVWVGAPGAGAGRTVAGGGKRRCKCMARCMGKAAGSSAGSKYSAMAPPGRKCANCPMANSLEEGHKYIMPGNPKEAIKKANGSRSITKLSLGEEKTIRVAS